jgi:hypothetical protein
MSEPDLLAAMQTLIDDTDDLLRMTDRAVVPDIWRDALVGAQTMLRAALASG